VRNAAARSTNVVWMACSRRQVHTSLVARSTGPTLRPARTQRSAAVRMASAQRRDRSMPAVLTSARLLVSSRSLFAISFLVLRFLLSGLAAGEILIHQITIFIY